MAKSIAALIQAMRAEAIDGQATAARARRLMRSGLTREAEAALDDVARHHMRTALLADEIERRLIAGPPYARRAAPGQERLEHT